MERIGELIEQSSGWEGLHKVGNGGVMNMAGSLIQGADCVRTLIRLQGPGSSGFLLIRESVQIHPGGRGLFYCTRIGGGNSGEKLLLWMFRLYHSGHDLHQYIYTRAK